MTGRKAGIHAAIAALAEENHDIDLFVLAKDAEQARPVASARRAVWLGTPSKLLVLGNAAWSVLRGSYSLNEALFRSRKILARARRLRHGYDFAIADTIRAAPYAHELGVPWHLDLDDLYSTRYEKYLENPGQLSAQLLLGYYRDSVPRIASALPQALLRRLLEGEAVRLRSREVHWARQATSVSLASPDEAESFARIASRQVHSRLMSGVRIPALRWTPDKVNGVGPAFLGGLDYKPNLDALLYYQEQIYPLLRGLPGWTPRLTHIGKSPPELRRRFLPEVVRFEGYVTDVVPRLSGAAFFVAPIVNGTGIKTKVLEAMALGLPVLATPQAVAGLKVEHRNHCFICERPAQFAEGMQYLRNADVAERMGVAARNYVETNFSSDALRQRWRRVVDALAQRRKACSAR